MGKSFIKEISASMTRQVGVTAFGLLLSVIIARSWGPTGSGWFFMCQFLPALAFSLTVAGFPASITFTLSSKSKGHESLLLWVLARLPYVILLQWGVIAIYVFGFTESYFNESNIPLIVIALLTALFSLKQLILAILQAKKKIVEYNQSLATESIATVIFIFIFEQLQVPMLISISSSLFIAVLLGFLPATLPLIKNKELFSKSTANHKDTLVYALKSYPSSIIAFLANRFSIFFITAFFNIEYLGIFSIALSLAEKLLTLARAASLSIFPRLAEKKFSSEIHTPLIASVTFWITLVATGVLVSIARPLINWLYGDMFIDATNYLYIMATAIPFFAVSRILAQDFAGKGRPELNSLTSSIAIVTNIILCFALYRHLQILAVVIAYTTSMIVNALFKILLWHYQTRQSPWCLFLPDIKIIKKYLN